jgi:glycosyltransferase involved in cell wall biosynthesis
LATGNFQPRKQLDKLLKVFRGLSDRNNFVLNITGHGDKANTELIKSLAEPLMKKKKAILHSFVDVEKLRDIYWASDIYISTAMEEGGPVSVMKAMACGLPVVSTPTGNTVELMKKHVAGKFIPANNYDKWAQSITEILDGNIPSKIDINIARNTFDWKDVAQRFIQVYHNLCVRKY